MMASEASEVAMWQTIFIDIVSVSAESTSSTCCSRAIAGVRFLSARRHEYFVTNQVRYLQEQN